MKLLEAKHIHFIGVGGIGTSSLAQILHHKGKRVTGSDQTPSEITKSLKLSGIKIQIGHEQKIPQADLVIYSEAIPSTNTELQAAKKQKIETISYPQALGQLTKEYFTVAIAGTHGKSTTTAMTALIAVEAEYIDPTVIVGTKIKEFGNKNYRVGENNLLIVEACEYKEGFLNLHPDILVITNIEAEHLDYFKTFQNYLKAFEKLCANVPKAGKIIINTDQPHTKDVAKNAKAELIEWSEHGKTHLKLHDKKLKTDLLETKINPAVPGHFNIQNATAAAITSYALGIAREDVENAISSFKGTWRRMDHKKVKGLSPIFIDDYAHHPTEIELTLKAIREDNPKKRILVVFQPHQYSRTRELLLQFARVFHEVDQVIIPDIYAVRDTKEDIASVSAQELVDKINLHSKNAQNGSNLNSTAELIKTNHKKYDIIVTMGAGNIHDIYQKLN